MPCDLSGTYTLTGHNFHPTGTAKTTARQSTLVVTKIEGNTYRLTQTFIGGGFTPRLIGVGTFSDDDIFVFSVSRPAGETNELVYIEVKKCKKDKAQKLIMTKFHTSGTAGLVILTGIRSDPVLSQPPLVGGGVTDDFIIAEGPDQLMVPVAGVPVSIPLRVFSREGGSLFLSPLTGTISAVRAGVYDIRYDIESRSGIKNFAIQIVDENGFPYPNSIHTTTDGNVFPVNIRVRLAVGGTVRFQLRSTAGETGNFDIDAILIISRVET